MSIKTIHPWYYTAIENGVFRPWFGGPVSMTKLQRLKGSKGSVLVQNTLVHSFIFESPANHPARWDCRNGWTVRMGEARLQNPDGKHGEKPPHWQNLQLFKENEK